MTSSKNFALVIIIISGLILIMGGLVIKRIFFYHYLKEIKLANNFLITSQWKEVGNSDLLKSRKEIQYISILVKPPYEIDDQNGGIKTPDGSTVNPEIRLLDTDGNEYKLTFGGSRHFEDKNFANYRYDKDLPSGKDYSKVLIRSTVSIPAKQIIWSGYDAKDLP